MSLLLASSRGPFASFAFDPFRGAKDEHLTHPNQAKGLAVTFKLSKISSIEKEGNPLRCYLLNRDLLWKLLKRW